jgi:hypothetical protein
VSAHGCRVDVGPGGELVVGAGACLVCPFGDVLGDVCGYGVIVGPLAVGTQLPGVDLGAPAQRQLTHGRAVRGADQDPTRRCLHGIGEPVGSAPGRWVISRSVRAVEPDDGVHVDGRPLLVLGDAGEGQPRVLSEAGLHDACRGGEAAPDVDDEAVPQLGGVRVPQYVAGVVVAVRAERLADEGIGRVVNGAAAEGTAVLAGAAIAARSAQLPSPVDRPEGRGGEGDEQTGPGAHGGGDVLASEETRADEVEGVARVEPGAGRTDGYAAVAAADQEAFAGFTAGVVVLEDLSGCPVQDGG